MDRAPNQPLTVDQARLNLVLAADELDGGAWLRDHLWSTALAALALGVAFGAVPAVRKPIISLAVGLVKLV